MTVSSRPRWWWHREKGLQGLMRALVQVDLLITLLKAPSPNSLIHNSPPSILMRVLDLFSHVAQSVVSCHASPFPTRCMVASNTQWPLWCNARALLLVYCSSPGPLGQGSPLAPGIVASGVPCPRLYACLWCLGPCGTTFSLASQTGNGPDVLASIEFWSTAEIPPARQPDLQCYVGVPVCGVNITCLVL